MLLDNVVSLTPLGVQRASGRCVERGTGPLLSQHAARAESIPRFHLHGNMVGDVMRPFHSETWCRSDAV